jgi:surfeit locus 1 family protein
MSRRVPIISTLIVALAVATMIGLGVWQLRRAEWKADLLARYERAQTMSSNVPWPDDPTKLEAVLFRHSQFTCFSPAPDAPVAGRNTSGDVGWAHVFSCYLDYSRMDSAAPKASVVMGWSKEPGRRAFGGGRVRGVIGPSGRLFVDPDLVLSGLHPNARPDPRDIPNNHLMYAGQWFLFALTALVIYVLALRKRWRE